jgi:hypothetical protein
MTRSLEHQAQLFTSLAQELAAITPSGWSEVELIVRVAWGRAAIEVELELASPEGHPRAEIAASQELGAAVDALLVQIRDDGDRIVQMRAVSRRTAEGWWELDSELDYAPPPRCRSAPRRSPAS